MKFSANLGFLWPDRPLPDAIRCAYQAGYDAVECHWPYDVPTDDVKAALQETGLSMLGLNTRRGDVTKGDNGLSALPGRELEAIDAIDEAIEYATAIGTKKVHVMAGFASGEAARQTFISNLRYASTAAKKGGITILIEPLNHVDAPGYFLQTTTQALSIINETGCSNIKLMFDCYHIQIMEGDIVRRAKQLLPYIGHVQFASVPDRSEPDTGELNYNYILSEFKNMGYTEPFGAEYKPTNNVSNGAWIQKVNI